MILLLKNILSSKLKNDFLLGNVTGVFYYVPHNTKFPYVYIGDFQSKNISTKDQDLEEINFKLIIYSRNKSLEEILEIANILRKILKLDQKIILNFIDQKLTLQNDGVTHQLVMNFQSVLYHFPF